MTPLGWVGVSMLGAGAVAIVFEGVLAGVWGLRISRRADDLRRRTESELASITADMERLRRALEETTVLWQPYQRALRWLRHPLTAALLRSYRRRRAAAR